MPQKEKKKVRIKIDGTDRVTDFATDDLSDETREALWKRALADGTEVSRYETGAPEPEAPAVVVKAPGGATAASSKPSRESGMVLKIDGMDVTMARGDMSDEAWEEVKKAQQDQGTFYGVQVEEARPAAQVTQETIDPKTGKTLAYKTDIRPGALRPADEHAAEGVARAKAAAREPYVRVMPEMDLTQPVQMMPGMDLTEDERVRRMPVMDLTGAQPAEGDVPGAGKFFGRAVSGAATQAMLGPDRTGNVTPADVVEHEENLGMSPAMGGQAEERGYQQAIAAEQQKLDAMAPPPTAPQRGFIPPPAHGGPPAYSPETLAAERESARYASQANIAKPEHTKGLEKQITETAEAQIVADRKAAEIAAERMRIQASLVEDNARNTMKHRADTMALRERQEERQEQARKAIDTERTKLREIGQIDPNRYWATKGVGHRILGAVAAALGGIAQGSFAALGIKQENQALQIIRNAIQDDIDAQKENIGTRRWLGEMEISGSENAYARLRQAGFDEIEARNGQHALMLDATASEIEKYGLMYGSEEAVAKANSLAALVRQGSVEKLQKLAQHRDAVDMEVGQVRVDAALAKSRGAGERAQRGAQLDLQKIGEDAVAIQNMTGNIDSLLGRIETEERGWGLSGAGLWDSTKPGFFNSPEDDSVRMEALGAVAHFTKLISGQAASEPEAKRLRDAYGLGSWTTEQAFKLGVRKFAEDARLTAAGKRAKYAPELIEEFQRRGGRFPGARAGTARF